ncbi:PfkB family carbohydrate kinase [Methanocella arvoryzae]|uniref:ATP-dependent phosphofructokinase (PFK-B family) n=1 Tax=Methanocella arvoryzae (strain DSM 22066 / NBRC 105507 / MRE50) TaxID=351160 RepID=Q0W1B5_METAR|nr:PfkB family carbohydrate kinase [Methanocella arvoryzae]CAJ37828.1 putative ATP-dependent phosphofructokinase (PFK-B family) [Methanocella arvoryzae MRE50]
MVDVIMVGTVALDTVRTPFGLAEETLGGSAVYASVAASLFASVGLVGVVGKDFPQKHVDFLRAKGVDMAGLETLDGETFRWKGYYEYDMNQAHTQDTQLNVLSRFDPVLPPEYRDCKYVFLANTDPEIQMRVYEQINKPKLVMMDTMNFWIESKKEALSRMIEKVDVMLTNDAEARQFFDTPSLVKAGKAFLEMGPKAVIIKKGEHGALMFTEDQCFSAPAYPLEKLTDPTGAGDSFAGGFIGWLARTDDISPRNMRKAVIFGSTIASYNAEAFSLDKLKTISRDDVFNRYMRFQDIASF